MTVARTAAEVLDEHATLELECVDRMYLNAYVPILQTCGGAAWFFRKVRGKPVPSSALMAPMSRDFVAAIERFVERVGVELVKFGRRNARRSACASICGAGPAARACCSSARRRRRRAWCARSAGRTSRAAATTCSWCTHGDGQPLLRLPGGRRLRADVREVLLVLPVHGAGVRQRPRVRQAAAGQARRGLRGAGQRPPVVRRPGAGAAAGRRTVGGEDRRPCATWLRRLPHPFARDDRAAGIRYEVSVLLTRSSRSPRSSTGPCRVACSSRR